MTKINLKWHEKVTFLAIVALLISNPLTGQYLVMGINWVLDELFIYSPYIVTVCTVYLFVYMAVRHHQNNKLNIPVKSKTKTQKYIET